MQYLIEAIVAAAVLLLLIVTATVALLPFPVGPVSASLGLYFYSQIWVGTWGGWQSA